MPNYIISFKCDSCNKFSYIISATLKGINTTCRCCSAVLTKQSASGENPHMPNGREMKASIESAEARLKELLEIEEKAVVDTVKASKSVNGDKKDSQLKEVENQTELKKTTSAVSFSKNPIQKNTTGASSVSYYIRRCRECNRYVILLQTDTKCASGHRLDVSKPPEYKTTKKIEALKKLAEFNRAIAKPVDEKQEQPLVVKTSITWNLRSFSQNEVREFHEMVYRTWGINAIFKKSLNGALTFKKPYLGYLAGFEEGTVYKNIANNYEQIENNLMSAEDDNQRFYVYLHENGLLPRKIPLCWNIDGSIQCFNTIEDFVQTYLGRKSFNNLTKAQMQQMLNQYTMQYFLFPQDENMIGGIDSNELRFTYLIMSNTKERSLVYKNEQLGSVDQFVDSMDSYGIDMKKKLDFIQNLIGSFDESSAHLINEIFKCDKYELQYATINSLEDAYITDNDKTLLPEWSKIPSLIEYLSLCVYKSKARGGRLRVFDVDFGDSCDTLIKTIKAIVNGAYKSNATETDKRKFAILRLCYFSGVLDCINGFTDMVYSENNIIGSMKTLFDDKSQGSLAKIISEAYYICLDASERAQAKFLYNGRNYALHQHVNNIKNNPEALRNFWENNEVQRFISYIISGNGGGSEIDEINKKIDDIYEQCINIESRLVGEINKINARYNETLKDFEVSPTNAITPKTTKTTGNSINDNTNTDTNTKNNTNSGIIAAGGGNTSVYSTSNQTNYTPNNLVDNTDDNNFDW